MNKLLIMLIFLTGCSKITGHEEVFLKTQKECPIRCEIKNQKWTGFIKAETDKFNCICEKEIK